MLYNLKKPRLSCNSTASFKVAHEQDALGSDLKASTAQSIHWILALSIAVIAIAAAYLLTIFYYQLYSSCCRII